MPVVAFGTNTISSTLAPSKGAIAVRELSMRIGRSKTMNVSGRASARLWRDS